MNLVAQGKPPLFGGQACLGRDPRDSKERRALRLKLGRCALREGSEGSSRLRGRHQNLLEAPILETPKLTRQVKHMEANNTHKSDTLDSMNVGLRAQLPLRCKVQQRNSRGADLAG